MTKKYDYNLRKLLFKLIITLLIVIALNLFTLKYYPINLIFSKALYLICAVWVSLPLVIATRESATGALKSFKMKAWRIIINTRRYYQLTKINNFLLHAGTLGILITGTLQVTFNIQITILTYLVVIFLSTSFILDIYHRVKFIISKIWKGVIGKIFLTLYTTLALMISNYLIRHWITYTTKVDPKYFAEFASSFSIFFTPIAYIAITIVLCLLVIIPECIGLLILILLNPLKDSIVQKRLPSLVILTVRMRTGKRPTNLTYLEQVLMSSKIMAFRVLSAPFFLISICYLMTQIDHLSGDFLDKAGRLLLVNYYYHTEHNSKLSTMRYYTLDNSKTSVAILKDGKWQFFTLDI